MKQYRNRIVDRILLEKLEAKGAVLIEGPKWCGKTTTASQVAKSSIDLREVAYLICRGGWPRALDQSRKTALRQAFDYYDAVVASEISAVPDINGQNTARTAKSICDTRSLSQFAQTVPASAILEGWLEELSGEGQ